MPCIPSSMSAVGALALCLLCTGPAWAEEPAGAEVAIHEQQARQSYDAGRYAEAVASWERVLATRPDDPRAQLGLAQALHGVATRDSLRRAEKMLARLGTQDGTQATPTGVQLDVDTTWASVLVELAEREQGEDRLRLIRQATRIWERVLVASPSHPKALSGLAKAHLALEQDDAGVEYAERYIGLCRESRSRWEKQREQWAAQTGGAATPEQLRFFTEKMENARKEEVEMLLVLGGIHLIRNKPEQAITRFDALLELDPARSAAYLGRATAQVALARHAAAVEDLERCLETLTEDTAPEVRKATTELLARCRRVLAEDAPPR